MMRRMDIDANGVVRFTAGEDYVYTWASAVEHCERMGELLDRLQAIVAKYDDDVAR